MAHSGGYSITVCCLGNLEKMGTTLKGITELERFWLVGPIHTKLKMA